MSNETASVKSAFDNLMDALVQKVEKGFDKVEAKVKGLETEVNEKRLTKLQADLEELDKRKRDASEAPFNMKQETKTEE